MSDRSGPPALPRRKERRRAHGGASAGSATGLPEAIRELVLDAQRSRNASRWSVFDR